MMGTVIVIFFAIIFVISSLVITDKVAKTILYFYLGWWALCLFVSTLNLFGIYPVSPFTYFLLILNVGCFAAGYMAIGQHSTIQPGSLSYISLFNSLKKYLETNKKLVTALIAFSVYLLYYFIKFQNATSYLSGSAARTLRFSVGAIFSTTIEMVIYNYFADTAAIFLIIIIASSLIIGRIRTWVFFWSILDLVLYVGVGAGRTLIVEAGLFVVMVALLRNIIQPKPNRLKSQTKVVSIEALPKRKNLLVFVVLPIVLLVAFSIYITAFRSFDIKADWELASLAGTLFLDQAQYYSTGPFRALDYAINHPYLYGYHYGALTFGSLDDVAAWPFRMMGLQYSSLNETIGGILDNDIYIGSNYFNALYSCVFRFYFDFGVPGVAILSLLFGLFLRRSIILFNAFPCFSTLSISLYLFGASFLSSQNFHLAGLSSLIFLFAGYSLYRYERRNGNFDNKFLQPGNKPSASGD